VKSYKTIAVLGTLLAMIGIALYVEFKKGAVLNPGGVDYEGAGYSGPSNAAIHTDQSPEGVDFP
jgi:hypothetical protein